MNWLVYIRNCYSVSKIQGMSKTEWCDKADIYRTTISPRKVMQEPTKHYTTQKSPPSLTISATYSISSKC